MSLYFALELTQVQIALFALLLLLLCVELLYLYLIYNKVPRFVQKVANGGVRYATELPSVSVVVYAHDDKADGLMRLLPRLMSQDYHRYEVIIVTDNITDEVQRFIDNYELEYRNVYHTHVPNTVYNVSRKKLGITLGIKAAKNDVILLTDANCCPVSDNWIGSMAQNFIPGVDVVLGYTHMRTTESRALTFYRAFDCLTFNLRYMAYALMQKTYMGMGSNLAYRKEAFFANKGFSATLQLHFGDDDLLVNELSRKGNTRIEVSNDSFVDSFHENCSEAWDDLRMRYGFTSRYIKSSSKRLFAMETLLHLLWMITWVVTLIVDFGNILSLIISFTAIILYWLLTWHVYRSAQRALGERCAVGLTPIYYMLRPCFSLYYLMKGNKYNKCHYTWQYLR